MPEVAHIRVVPSVSAELYRYFEIFLYLLVLMGFVTLATAGGLGLTSLLLACGAFVLRGYCLVRGRKLLIPDGWTNILTLTYVAFYLADYVVISRTFLKATVHLVVFVTLVRLFSAKRDRDYYFLAVLAFLMVLAAAILTVDSMFLVAFAGFMLAGVAAFILMEMRYSSAKAALWKQVEHGTVSTRLGLSLAGTAPAIVFLILCGATAIFFLLPRMSAGYLSAYAIKNELATGFSDRVELGRIGQIQQSTALVMHVQIDGDNEGRSELKLRGITLNVFDGRAWTDAQARRNLMPIPNGRFILSAPEDRAQLLRHANTATPMLQYRVLMEPVGTNIFFLAATPMGMQGAYRQVALDGGGALFDLDAEHPVSRYEAWSDVTQPNVVELRQASASYPKGLAVSYLQLPQLDGRIPILAAQITSSATNNYDKAAALESYLRTHFAYTLQLSAAPPRDPLAEFLFDRKRGHCEYFASSMAIMLRVLGIPSRVVNGFRISEFNDLTGQYMVRESDAHSWVEAYFPGFGWMSFDPTPAGPSLGHNRWARFLLYVDAMQSFWRDWVVNYDVRHQAILGQDALRSSRQSWFRFRRWALLRYVTILKAVRRLRSAAADSPGRWTMAGLLMAMALVFASLGTRLTRALQRRRLASRPEAFPRQAAEIWYERMTRLLERRGWTKRPAQTPGEFVAAVDDTALQDKVARFTRHYEWARFGNSPNDARQLAGLYQNIATSYAGRRREQPARN